MFIAHRINTIKELENIPEKYGVEVDIRDYNGRIILSHDPLIDGESLEHYLKKYKHKFIIFNIKSERLEYEVLKLVKQHGIKNYLFLDSSFPMVYNLISIKEKNIALRFSEFEPIESVLKLAKKIKWVWVDCFKTMPLTPKSYIQLKDSAFKICIVSPELQNQEKKIIEYKNYLLKNRLIPDMICTKSYNIEKWEGLCK
jgi:hypothetical protein